jgi:uncharacterized protein (DUF3820 family)
MPTEREPSTAGGTVTLPFGKYRDMPLSWVPGDYLAWLVGSCKLSSGLLATVAAELERRGLEAPVAPPWQPPPCRRCPAGAGVRYGWQADRLDRRHVRAACRGCGRFLAFAPSVPPYTNLADAVVTGEVSHVEAS